MITLVFDNKPRHVRFTLNAVTDAEALTGKNLLSLLLEGGMRTTRALLWAGMKWEDRALTPEKVGDMMEKWITDGKSYNDLERAAIEALQESGWYAEMMRQAAESQGVGDDTSPGESDGGQPPGI